MLQDAADIVKRVGVLLDDPSNSQYDTDYLMPWIDQEYDILDVDLELLGMQYIESNALVNLTAGQTDLTPLLADGQALATMKVPKKIRWWLTSQPEYTFSESIPTDELDAVTPQSIGAYQWTFIDGAIAVTPSAVPVTLRIYFDQVSTNIYDPQQNVIRGTAHILALQVAKEVATIKGMSIAASLEMKRMKAWDAFAGVLVKQRQGKRPLIPRIHSTIRRTSPAGYI
jgi:hypothetical protein